MVNVCSMGFHTTDVKLGKADHLEVKIGFRWLWPRLEVVWPPRPLSKTLSR